MEDLAYCDVVPWYNEVCTRMHEAHAAGQTVVNLSSTHPRGFIPNQILRRPVIRELLQNWQIDAGRYIVDMYPVGNIWAPAPGMDFTTCDLVPFLNEIELRHYEAEVEAYNKALQSGQKEVPVIDLTNYHPRGGIPDAIITRLDRRKSKKWVDDARAEVARLRGEANKAEAFAKVQAEKGASFNDDGRDGSNLLHGAEQLKLSAISFREQAKLLELELVGV